jgi:hypothetical protein
MARVRRFCISAAWEHGIFEGFMNCFEAVWDTAKPAYQEVLPGVARTLRKPEA